MNEYAQACAELLRNNAKNDHDPQLQAIGFGLLAIAFELLQTRAFEVQRASQQKIVLPQDIRA